MSYNLNKWAKDITLAEGKKSSLSIAQVKEVLKIVLDDLAVMPLEAIVEILKKR